MNADGVHDRVRAYIHAEFLAREANAQLADDTPLLTGGIIDSMGVLRLVDFREDAFQVRFESFEIDAANLNTIADISRLIASKRAGPS